MVEFTFANLTLNTLLTSNVHGLILKEKPEEITIEGKVLDKEKRKVVKHDASVYSGIPKKPLWKKFLTAELLDIRLVRDNDGELIMVITRPKGDMP